MPLCSNSLPLQWVFFCQTSYCLHPCECSVSIICIGFTPGFVPTFLQGFAPCPSLGFFTDLPTCFAPPSTPNFYQFAYRILHFNLCLVLLLVFVLDFAPLFRLGFQMASLSSFAPPSLLDFLRPSLLAFAPLSMIGFVIGFLTQFCPTFSVIFFTFVATGFYCSSTSFFSNFPTRFSASIFASFFPASYRVLHLLLYTPSCSPFPRLSY